MWLDQNHQNFIYFLNHQNHRIIRIIRIIRTLYFLFTVVVLPGPGSDRSRFFSPQLSIRRRYRILLRNKSDLERCHKQLADQVGDRRLGYLGVPGMGSG